MELKKKLTNEEVRNIQLEILDNFINFCSTHNLKYSLTGGSLLGAVRHQGFIPWDDDIDLMMPRADYEIFVKSFNTDNIKKSIKCFSYENNKTWNLLFSKLMDTNTILFETTTKGEHENIEMGVFVDVFPIDGCSDNWKKELQRIKFYNRILISHLSIKFNNSIKLFLSSVLKSLFSIEYAQNKANKLLKTYVFGNTKYAGVIVGVYGEKEIYTYDTFSEYTELLFENRKIMCIKNFDKYLIQHYGNTYMELPPMEKRIVIFQTAYLKNN